ncbi:hypothetical protein SteCoe_2506 [Stentor coeruleus]|uniref:Uncharacterized protein n=1 Tax=Stentor coeruleus TaxID=5963 RepID=A0A1R2CZ73_9CILI|nr:hypothetical protein SteCoe_2506 [Stentor coeruleus]
MEKVPDEGKRNSYVSQTQVKTDSTRTIVVQRQNLGKVVCGSCKKNKKCEVFHDSCIICQGCIIESIHSKNSKCFLCGKSVILSVKSKFTSKKEWVCDSCGRTGKARKLECGCLLCEDSCSKKAHNCT